MLLVKKHFKTFKWAELLTVPVRDTAVFIRTLFENVYFVLGVQSSEFNHYTTLQCRKRLTVSISNELLDKSCIVRVCDECWNVLSVQWNSEAPMFVSFKAIIYMKQQPTNPQCFDDSATDRPLRLRITMTLLHIMAHWNIMAPPSQWTPI